MLPGVVPAVARQSEVYYWYTLDICKTFCSKNDNNFFSCLIHLIFEVWFTAADIAQSSRTCCRFCLRSTAQ